MNNMEQMPFRRTEKVPPSMVELEAVQRAVEVARKEKEVKLESEKKEHAVAERIRKLWQAEEASKSEPHVITEKDMQEAEEAVGKKFEKLN